MKLKKLSFLDTFFYIQHQEGELLDLLPHRTIMLQSFQGFSSQRRGIGGKELILQFILESLQASDMGPSQFSIIVHFGLPL